MKYVAIRLLMCLVAGLAGAAAHADEPPKLAPLPSFEICIDKELARFERALTRHHASQRAGSAVQEFEIGGVTGVDLCGAIGITNCDRSGDTIPCQRDLRLRQEALFARVSAALPHPDAIVGGQQNWLGDLYARVFALAHGGSAGPDCAGDHEARQVWCESWEANRTLASAILAWQVARYLGQVPSAIAQGWAHEPPPTRPRARGDAA
ncbi:MAG: hypothetical protein N4A61_05230 [Pelagimonas sp.]|jgi:hypothetical protein|nr:hypothetical protein [Pelagimonas sp.]